MIVSSITQTKAEVQKLIKRYNKLQAEAKGADRDEAERKAVQAEKLISQINTLQSALSKTQAKEIAVQAKKNTATTKKTSIPSATSTLSPGKRIELVEDKKIELEERINRIEEAQKKTRVQIEQLNLAKAELSRLQMEAEKTVEQRRANNERLPQAQEIVKLNGLIQSKDVQYQNIQKELDTVRQQAQKDTNLLREERDVAIEKQKQLEKEKMDRLRYGDSGHEFLKGFSIGIGLGFLGIVVIVVVLFKTTWLDDLACSLKSSPTQCFSPQTSIMKNSKYTIK